MLSVPEIATVRSLLTYFSSTEQVDQTLGRPSPIKESTRGGVRPEQGQASSSKVLLDATSMFRQSPHLLLSRTCADRPAKHFLDQEDSGDDDEVRNVILYMTLIVDWQKDPDIIRNYLKRKGATNAHAQLPQAIKATSKTAAQKSHQGANSKQSNGGQTAG